MSTEKGLLVVSQRLFPAAWWVLGQLANRWLPHVGRLKSN